MPAPTARELVSSRESNTGEQTNYVKRFRIDDTTEEDVAYQTAIAASPVTGLLHGILLRRRNVHIVPDGYNHWLAEISYGPKGSGNEVGDWELTWDTTAVQEKITQSLGTRRVNIDGTAADYNGAIGVVKSGSSTTVEGCQIYVPKFAWSVTYTFDGAAVTSSMAMIHYGLTGKLNSGSFWGFGPGEVLFLGGRGTTGSSAPTKVTLSFLSAKDATVNTAGKSISKRGWEYLWYAYKEKKDDDAKVVVQKPLGAYLETVYESANLAALGIGT